MPALQFRGDVRPAVGQNVPAGHTAHELPAAKKVPATQLLAAAAVWFTNVTGEKTLD